MPEPCNIGASETAIGDELAMTLASIAYCTDIPATLAATLPGWSVAWLPTREVEGNLAYIAFNGAQYVLAIRGSELNFSWAAFDNWFKQDLNVFTQEEWVYPADSGTKPKISRGSAEGLSNLNALIGTDGKTMLEYLMVNCVEKGKLLGVTGHSLGANLSTVLAPWLRYQIKQAGKPVPALFSVLTFAAPTAGNKAFADMYDAEFTNTWRYFNCIDIVPMASKSVMEMGSLYPLPAPAASGIDLGGGVTLSEGFNALAGLIIASEAAAGGSFYTHTNQNRGAIELNKQREIFPVTGSGAVVQWFEQAGEQHARNHYLSWLDGKPVSCSTSGNEAEHAAD